MTTEFSVDIGEGNDPGTKVVHITGELDEVTVKQLQENVDPLLADTTMKQLVFDFTSMTFINSKGIGYLVSVHSHLTKDGRNMKMAGASESVMDVLSLVGLTNIIPYSATLEEALKQA